jgi:L-alanine-DL-glutamate epimerase-like enolase superfamily enzyme
MFVRRRALIEVVGPVSGARSRGQSWKLRRSLLLVLSDEDGRTGFGEASPLPGWSREELATSRWALEALSNPFEIEGEVDAVDALVREIPPMLASARFALETALYDLVAKRKEVSVASLLEPRRERLPLCQSFEEGDRVEAGTIRVQAGLQSFPEELERLKRLRRSVGSEVRMRVHFDRAIPWMKLHDCLSRLAELDLELVEEPAPTEQVLKLHGAPVPLALDDSLLSSGELLEDLAGLQLLRALVLRPMFLGGARVALRLAEWAQQLGLAVTVAHSFDGPVAHAMSSAIALALTGEVLPAELWPHSGLRAWGERDLPHVAGAFIVTPPVVGLGVAELQA